MPWRQEAMKGVASCDKPRGAASRLRSEDARMGKPGWGNAQSSVTESIGGATRTEGTETSQYLEEEKENSISSVAASEREIAQTAEVFLCGVVGPFTWELQSERLTELSGKSDHSG